MRSLFSIAFLFLTVFAFSQSRHSIDIFGTGILSYRNLNEAEVTAFSQAVIESRSIEVPKGNYAFGLSYNLRLTQNLFARLGLGYTSLGYARDIDNFVFPDILDTNGGISPSPANGPARQVLDYRFVQVPLLLRYEVGQKRVKPYVEMGVSWLAYLDTRQETTANNGLGVRGSIGAQDAVRSSMLSGNVALGLNVKLTSRFQLFFQSVSQYMLRPIAEGAVAERLYSTGLEAGIRTNL